MSIPYFPMYPDDFEADTAHLTLAEDGAYNRLLRLQWRTPGCKLPADEAWIMRKMRATSDVDKEVVKVILDEFFRVEKQTIFSLRLLEEWQKAHEAHARRVASGSKGGKAKPRKTNETCSSNAIAKPKQPEPEPDNTIPNGMDGAAVGSEVVDFTKEVFDRGIAFLSKFGTPEKQARSLIGKWRKQAGDTETFNAFRDASRAGITDPVPWITARLKPRPPGPDLDAMFAEIKAENFK